jgi:hypothetical protein
MANKKQIRNIKVNIERTIQGLRTKPREFIYDDTNSYVKPDTLYSVYYTLSKTEQFLTGILESSTSRMIRPTGQRSLYGQYTAIKSTQRQKYPKTTPMVPSESDYRIGEITRYFTQRANNPNSEIFEISKEDSENENSLYKYTIFQWRISGTREEVIRENQGTIRSQQREYPNITKVLFPLQLWIPPKNSPDDLEKKLSLLANG